MFFAPGLGAVELYEQEIKVAKQTIDSTRDIFSNFSQLFIIKKKKKGALDRMRPLFKITYYLPAWPKEYKAPISVVVSALL